jgi:hypothetical protein
MYLDKEHLIILGGSNFPVEVFNYKSGKMIKNHPCVDIFKENILELNMKKGLKKYLLL